MLKNLMLFLNRCIVFLNCCTFCTSLIIKGIYLDEDYYKIKNERFILFHKINLRIILYTDEKYYKQLFMIQNKK